MIIATQRNSRLIISLCSLTVMLLLQGCAKSFSYNPLPSQLENQAQAPGFPNVRAWGDTPSATLTRSANQAVQQEMAANHGKLLPDETGLALSGGGQDGAFGAGLLCGWTASGTRPKFKLVTGISTGALMAPFAFLGSEYDSVLKEAYTTISDKDIYAPRSPLAVLLAILNIRSLSSLADDDGLEDIIAKLIDENLLKKIAAEHLKGRRLLIGTTQLNAQRLVIWDMGAIAVQNTPEALALFRKILLASASIPVTFPPQYFKVEAAGQLYDEMHVDGGVESEVILFESAVKPFANGTRNYKKKRPRRLFIIRNQKVTPEWQNVKPALRYITTRALSSLTRSQGIGDLYRMYVYAQRDQIDYNLAFIPVDFTAKPKTPYDKVYMQKLFERGYMLGKSGYPWQHYPPGFQP